MSTNSKTLSANEKNRNAILAVLIIMCAKIVQSKCEYVSILKEITDSHDWESWTRMKFSVTVLMMGIFLAAWNKGKFNASKLFRKITIKSYRHLAQKGAKSFLTASLFSGIGQANHGHSWSFDYFDKKFGTISTTFEMLPSEIQTLANITEATEKSQAKHPNTGITDSSQG